MLQNFDIQSVFFQHIKDKLLETNSMVEEMAELLNISTDSAYRRIRGETLLTLDEIKKLSIHYNLSIDALMGIESDTVAFKYSPAIATDFDFTKYLKTVENNLGYIAQFDQKQITYAAKDIPLFHFFQIPEIGHFKLFFWQKTILNHPKYQAEKFSLKNIDPTLKQAGKKILDTYTTIPSIEIWNEDTINSPLRQIEYYASSGYFINNDDAIQLCDHLINLLNHTKIQSEAGCKFQYGLKPIGNNDNYKLYINELTIADNSNLVKTGDTFISYLSYNTFNFLYTSNKTFCLEMKESLDNLIQKSTLISGTAEKIRNQFFNKLINKVEEKKKEVQKLF